MCAFSPDAGARKKDFSEFRRSIRISHPRDESLLRRMILNLLDNAIKYTSEGGRVTVTCRRAGEEYVLSITDTGGGIPRRSAARIFERFFRVDKPVSRAENDGSGAGLGLSISRWIAEAHHGRLELTRSDSIEAPSRLISPSGRPPLHLAVNPV